MDEKLILSEILNIRKKMGLPSDGEYKNFLIETLNPRLILEGAEYTIIRSFLKGAFKGMQNMGDDTIEQILQRNPIDITVNGIPYRINGVAALYDMATAVKKVSPTTKTTDEVLTALFANKNNQQITDFKKNTTDNLNWMSLRNTRETHILNKNKYVAGTTIKKVNGVDTPVISSGSAKRTGAKGQSINVKPLDLPVQSIDDIFDNLEKNYLGKNADVRDPTDANFGDNWVDGNISNRTSAELENTSKLLTTEKQTFQTEITRLKKQVTDASTAQPPKKIADITESQATSLNNKLNDIQIKGESAYDNIISYYDQAALNKTAIKESEDLTEKTSRNIFDLCAEENEQHLVDDMLNNVESESLGERNWFVRWFRTNKVFGGSGSGWFSQTFKMPLDNIVSFYTNNKRLFKRDGPFYWAKEVVTESSGRYSFDEINLRMKFIVNQMQNVIKESLTNVEGKTFKNAANVEQRLKDLMKEMRDIASLQKFAGNIDDIIDPNTGRIDPTKIKDNSRIVELFGEAQFNELKEIADNIKKSIDTAANENVQGAKELKEFWEKSTAGGDKTNIDVMTEFFSGLDEASKKSKTPVSFNGSTEMFTDMLPFLKWFSGESWSSRFKDLETIGKGSWLLNNKVGGAIGKLPVAGEAITKGTGATIAFFKTMNDMFFRDFLFGALWNQFRYGRLTGIDELNRLMVKYGPIKQGIVLIIRETVVAAVCMAVAATFTEVFRAIDKGIGLFTDAKDDLPVEELLAFGMTRLGEFIGSDGMVISADKFREYLKMDFSDRIITFFSNPMNIKRLIPVGFAGDMLNVLTLGYAEGNDPDYFRISHDVGWFNSQFDEAFLSTGGLIYDIVTGNVRDPEAAEEQFLVEIDNSKERLQKWKSTGIFYGKEKINEINKNEQNVRTEIESLKNDPVEKISRTISNDEDYFKKFLTLLTLKHEPDFQPELEKYTNALEKEKQGLILWKDWYRNNYNNIGITDIDGKFWKIAKGSDINPNPVSFYASDKFAQPGQSQYRFYVLNPNDGKYYDLIYIDEFFTKERIYQIWDKYNEVYQRKFTQNELNDHNKFYEARKKELEERILNIENILKNYKSNGDCETYPETCEKINYRLDGGIFYTKYTDNSGNQKTKPEDFGVGLRGSLKKLESDHNKFVSDAKKSLGIKESRKTNNQIINKIMRNVKSQLFESKRFDEDDYKHWKDTFTFQSVDEKNPGQYKDVKLNMDDVMDRIPHYRKKYDEDDSFVRAVVDTHENVVRFMFTKDLANIREGYSAVGFAKILQQIRESRGEMEIWSVARPASGNWFLVKGDFTPKELMGMDLEKNEPSDKEPKKRENSLETLKKKELTSSNSLKNDEKSGFNELPKIVKKKLRDKFNFGWTTEEPNQNLMSYYDESEVKSVFGDDIKIYKLNANEEFFDYISQYSDSLPIKRGFCRSIQLSKNKIELTKKQKEKVRYVLNLCQNKFKDNLGLSITSR